MRPTLPRAIDQILCGFAALLLACHAAPAPVPPGPPIAAAPDVKVDTMEKECDAMLAALAAYQTCPNASDDVRRYMREWADLERQSLAAGEKAKPDAAAQHVMALACRRAAVSVKHAIERCIAGPEPKGDYGPDPRGSGDAE